MGAVPFMIDDLLRKNNVHMFSSNYTLYGDINERVMSTLATFTPEIEVYSIDESFLYFDGFTLFNLPEYLQKMRRTVLKNIGIPVCVGMGVTKTLAKAANRYAKKHKETNGTFAIDSEEKRLQVLKWLAIGDVWGIGRQYASVLQKHKVYTAYDFTQLPHEWVVQNMTVTGHRLQKELLGVSCIALEEMPPKKKEICTSRSFGVMQRNYADVEEAIVNHASHCAEKLRQEKSCAKTVTAFMYTNVYRTELKQYFPTRTVELPQSANSTMTIVQYARLACKEIFRVGYEYKKVGVIVGNITPEEVNQLAIFDALDKEKHAKLMKVLDKVNAQYGRDSLHVAVTEGDKNYRLRCERRSPLYTTKWSDIVKVKI